MIMNSTTTILYILSTLIFTINVIYCSQCDVPGLCLGGILHFDNAVDKVACWSQCKSTEGCAWFSFSTSIERTCILFEDCGEIDSNPQFISGQKECEFADLVRYLIAGGVVDGALTDTTEVVEFVKTDSTPSFGQLPSRRLGAVGAMFGNVAILCGGASSGAILDTCISHQASEWSQSHSMNEKRSVAAGIQINSTTLWILGGYEGNEGSNFLDSTEFIIQGKTNGIPGPKLPSILNGMCAVKLSETEIFVIGGWDGFDARNEVWIYNPQDGFSRKQGPSLSTPRYGHSCSTMKNGEKISIVTAGGEYIRDEHIFLLPSVEIYDPIDNTWYPGSTLPYGIADSAMSEIPDGVLLFGGNGNDENGYRDLHEILQLSAGTNSWNILDTNLKTGRSYHVMIPLQ